MDQGSSSPESSSTESHAAPAIAIAERRNVGFDSAADRAVSSVQVPFVASEMVWKCGAVPHNDFASGIVSIAV